MKILFVCTGNTCRSCMAEYILKSKKIPFLFVSSSGLFVTEADANENTKRVLKENKIEFSAHTPRQIDEKTVDGADRIYCMNSSQAEAIKSYFPSAENKTFTFSKEISDPYGRGYSAYETCFFELKKEIDKLFLVKEMEDGDISQTSEIEKECFSSPWSENAIRESKNTGTDFFVLKNNDTVIGYCGIKSIMDEGYITNIAVKKEFRKQGYGSMLLKTLLSYMEEKNLRFITLEVRESNKTAVSLYEKFGFKNEGIRKNFYSDPKENAIIMTRRQENEDIEH